MQAIWKQCSRLIHIECQFKTFEMIGSIIDYNSIFKRNQKLVFDNFSAAFDLADAHFIRMHRKQKRKQKRVAAASGGYHK